VIRGGWSTDRNAKMNLGAAPCDFQGAGFDFSSRNWGQQRSGSEVKKQKARFEIRSGLLDFCK
jgi:hypothetical protein